MTFGYRLDWTEYRLLWKIRDRGLRPTSRIRFSDRFVKGNDFALGTGLGLPICKVLIEKMGGRIGVSRR